MGEKRGRKVLTNEAFLSLTWKENREKRTGNPKKKLPGFM